MDDKSGRLKSTMFLSTQLTLLACLIVAALICAAVNAQSTSSAEENVVPGCLVEDRFFADEVWAKVGERTCLRCHNKNGDAAESSFLLFREGDVDGHDGACLKQNRDAFQAMAKQSEGEESRLLLKVIGELDHGGGQVLQPDSTGYRILKRFLQRLATPSNVPDAEITDNDYNEVPFFNDVAMIPPQRLLRRITLSLAGRLPTPEEVAAVEQNGPAAIDSVLDQIMQEDAFYVRLKEGFNDIFLTVGIEDNAEHCCLIITLKKHDCGISTMISAICPKPNDNVPDGKWPTSIAMRCYENRSNLSPISFAMIARFQNWRLPTTSWCRPTPREATDSLKRSRVSSRIPMIRSSTFRRNCMLSSAAMGRLRNPRQACILMRAS